MEYTTLGGIGLRVSRIGFGVYSLTGMYGEVPRSQAVEVLREAWRLGINFFDTADVYGYGLGETLLCEALGRETLEEAVIATKIGYDFYSSRPPRRRYDQGYLLQAARRSMERLCGVPPKLLLLHNPPLETLQDPETWEALARIREEGLALHTGVALGPETDVYHEALEALSHPETEALQFVYNILEQEPGASIAREAKRRNRGTIARVPHAGGVLDETVDPLAAEGTLRDHRSLRRRGWYRWAARVYSEMKPILETLPGTPGQRALRLILDTGFIDTVVVIANSVERLRDYAAAERLPPVPSDVIDKLRRIYLRRVAESPEKPRSIEEILNRLQGA